MSKVVKKVLTGVSGISLLAGGAVAPVYAEVDSISEVVYSEENAKEAGVYAQQVNVEGKFSFNQDEVMMADDAFNLFGTVVTGLCAKPSFELENSRASFYINVGGDIKKAYTISLDELKEKEEQRTMLCACATGKATTNLKVTGVNLSDILSLAEIDKSVNTITVKGSDGYGMPMPLSYVLDKKAMLVYKANDQQLPSGTQLWIPETVAKYFIRDVVDVILSTEDELPVIEGRDKELAAEVVIMNHVDRSHFALGDEITFEGYADDCGDAITAIEFSMDGGKTWTTYETKGATPERWVYWRFSVTPEAMGNYVLSVRAKTESGAVSPLAANVSFEVQNSQNAAKASL